MSDDNKLPATLAERITGKIDAGVMQDLTLSGGGDNRTPMFASMTQVMEFGKLMAVSAIAIRAHLRNNVGACTAVVLQAQRWGMDPFAVANKSYAVNDQLAYESQLITAVINTRAPIIGRLKVRYDGEGGNRRCIASATFKGDDKPTEVASPPIGQIKPKNSPLWATDPDQQLAYYTQRLWARRCAPEVLLGVYDPDELEERGPERARDVTPPRPQRSHFAAGVSDAGSSGGVADPEDAGGATVEVGAGVTERQAPEPWEFTDLDGEVVTFSPGLRWGEAFLATMSERRFSTQVREGCWETNSPMLARLRAEGPAGEKMAQAVHDAHDVMLAEAEAARKASEKRKEPEATAAPAESQTASGGEKKAPAVDLATLLPYAERIARNSGTEVLEAWHEKQSAQVKKALAAHWGPIAKLAAETDAHAAKMAGGSDA